MIYALILTIFSILMMMGAMGASAQSVAGERRSAEVEDFA